MTSYVIYRLREIADRWETFVRTEGEKQPHCL